MTRLGRLLSLFLLLQVGPSTCKHICPRHFLYPGLRGYGA